MENAGDFDIDILASDWQDACQGASRETISWYEEREAEELEEILAYDREQQEVW